MIHHSPAWRARTGFDNIDRNPCPKNRIRRRDARILSEQKPEQQKRDRKISAFIDEVLGL